MNQTKKLVIVIPAYNEELILHHNILTIRKFCQTHLGGSWQWRIVISDNHSTDATSVIGKDLAASCPEVAYHYVAQKGKGSAIRSAWTTFPSDVAIFMDADLATDLGAVPKMIEAIVQQGYDVVCGSRFAPGALVERSMLRKTFSYGYHFIAKIVLGLKTKDLPCGCKGVNRKVLDTLVPLIKNNEWFFDSELVILAEKKRYRVKEIPVTWREPKETGRKSQVNILALSWEYFKKLVEIKKSL